MKLYESLVKNIGIGMATANELAAKNIIKHSDQKSIKNLISFLKIPKTNKWLYRYCEEMFPSNQDFIIEEKPYYGVEARFSGELPYAYCEQTIKSKYVIRVDGVDFASDDAIDIYIIRIDENGLSILAGVPELDKVYAFLDKAFTKHRQESVQNHSTYTEMYIYDWKDTKTFNLTEATK